MCTFISSVAHDIHSSTWLKIMIDHATHTINYETYIFMQLAIMPCTFMQLMYQFFQNVFLVECAMKSKYIAFLCAWVFQCVTRIRVAHHHVFLHCFFTACTASSKYIAFLFALGHFGVLRESAFYVAMYFNNCFVLRLSLRSSLFNCRAPYIGTLGKFFVRLGSVLYILIAGSISGDCLCNFLC